MAEIIANNNKEQLNLWSFKTEVSSEELQKLKQVRLFSFVMKWILKWKIIKIPS
jgi:hypothetical protein